jgi:hypothetical protein
VTKNKINKTIFRMKHGRNLGPSLSFSSSDSSGTFNLSPHKNIVLQDPQLKITIPIYLVIKDYTPITGNNSKAWENALISLRRGLLLLKTISFLNDPRILEWKSVLKVISDSVLNLKQNTKCDMTSHTRWSNIIQYLSRSRRFISWVKIMKALNVLKNEFPVISVQSKSVFDSIKELLEGNSRLALRNAKKWDEEMRELPS